MTLSEQIEYINKLRNKVLEYEDYEFVIRNQIYYILFDLKTKLPLLEFRCHGTFSSHAVNPRPMRAGI